MMEQTKPTVLLNKFRSILLAAVVVETVSFLVSLTDTLVAAFTVGEDAIAAIGLVSPFFSIATFLAAVINSGTVLNYTRQIGLFNQRRAHEFFSEGVFLALVSGTVLTLVLALLKGPILSGFGVTGEKLQYVTDYYGIILFYFLMTPISCLLDNIVVADGGENLSAVANSIQIVGNVLLSFFLATKMGVKGIATATVICKAGFIVIICTWFFTKKCSLRLVRFFSLSDAKKMSGQGVSRALTFALTGIMSYLLHLYVLKRFDEGSFLILVMVEKILGLSSIFLGLSMSLQPLVGILMGETNTKAARFLFRRACFDMVVTGLIITAALIVFAPLVAQAFDLDQAGLMEEGIRAVYITSSTLPVSAVMVFFFICYFLMGKDKLTSMVTLLKDFVFPVGIAVLFGTVFGTNTALWAGIAAAPVLSMAACSAVVLRRYGKSEFPDLLPRDRDGKIFIYAFDATKENAARMSDTAGELLKGAGFSERLQVLAGTCIEEMVMEIADKNGGKDKLKAECNLILDGDTIRLTMRDNGILFNALDPDSRLNSFREYFISRIAAVTESKTYIAAAGYNRNEFCFSERAANAGAASAVPAET